MKRREFGLLIAVVFISGIHAMSRQQLKNTGKALRKTCMARNDITEDLVIDIEKGKFIEERNFMCYIACIFKLIQIVKNNKLNYEASMQHIERMYPADIKEPAKESIINCREPTKIKDLCEASYWTAKCMYDYSPKDFFFP